MTKNRSPFAFPFIESFDNSHLYLGFEVWKKMITIT